MKKIIYAVAVSALLIMASCGKKSNDAYTTYKGEYQGLKFTVEYPKTWNLEHNPNKPFCLFEAVSITPYSEDSLYQCVEMSTRVQQGMTLDSFVNERIDFFSQFEGFKLLEKEVNENESCFRYEIADEKSSMGTLMRIIARDDRFYGIDCSYMNNSQKDTVDYMIKSLKFY